jgi:hypothetical protein
MAESEKPTEASPAEKEQPDSTPVAASRKAEDKPGAEDKPSGADKSSEGKSSEDKSTEDKPAAEDKPSADNVKADPTKLEQHHVSKILDDVLEESDLAASAPSPFKHPLLLDMALTIGLLLAVGGFMLGIMNMWIAHQAKENIMHRNYKAAITMLKGVPFSGWFNIAGSDPAELLSQALYQEAMEKLDANDQDQSAVEELAKIPPGSAFFDNAQEIVKEHSTASAVQLQGKAEHEASPSEAVEPPKPLLPTTEEGKDASP